MVGLNFIYLSPSHAGGKDQVGFNLLRGLYENGWAKQLVIFCYDYSRPILEKIAPTVKIITVKSKIINEMYRIIDLYFVNTFLIPRYIRENNVKVLFHLSINNGLFKMKVTSIVIPHDIKQISNRVVGIEKTPFYKYYPYRVMYKLDFKHADRIVAISECDKNNIAKCYSKYAGKIVRIYNPVSVPSHINEVKPLTNKKYIVAINLQFTHKNIITLIKAFEIVKDEIEHDLVLIGKVPNRVSFLKEYVKNQKLGDRVIFTGFLVDNVKYSVLEKADLYVNPSLFEGFGLTAVEAMLLKVPTLMADLPINREVTKGLCQYYEPVEDERALAEKIVYCLNLKRNEMELSDYKKCIEAEYNYISISRKYIELFTNCVKMKGNLYEE